MFATRRRLVIPLFVIGFVVWGGMAASRSANELFSATLESASAAVLAAAPADESATTVADVSAETSAAGISSPRAIAGADQPEAGNAAASPDPNAAAADVPSAAPPAEASEATETGPPSAAAAMAEPAEPATTAVASSSAPTVSKSFTMPLLCLAVGVATVLGLIILLKVNAFIALITAAIFVSLMAPSEVPGDFSGKIARVASAFGSAAGSIGIVIAMAAVIGKCMLDSGAADRIVRAFLRLLGEKKAPIALMGSGFVLAVPVFFDTVFYLLVPLARSLYRTTNKNYLLYLMSIAAGGAITHTLVPPTPGPLMMAANLGFDVGVMILVGLTVALPSAVVGVVFSFYLDLRMPVPLRQTGSEPEPEPLADHELPSLWLSVLPVVLPVILIAGNTVLNTLADNEHAALLRVRDVSDWPAFHQAIREQSLATTATPGKRIVTVAESGRGRSEERQAFVNLVQQASPLTAEQQEQFVTGLNALVLSQKDFHRGGKEDAFLGVAMNPTAQRLLASSRLRMTAATVERMNRSILESAYANYIQPHTWLTPARVRANWGTMLGDANLVLLISTVIALLLVVKQRNLTRIEAADLVETSLMSGGVIILITAGGGAFGAMLEQAQIGEAIKDLMGGFGGAESGMLALLLLGFAVGALLKVAQGSSTVAMIVGTSMMAAIIGPIQLTFHPVYLACAVGAGSLVGSWMNDSGFWIFAKMGGLTEVEALKSWTPLLLVLAVTTLLTTIVLAYLVPLV